MSDQPGEPLQQPMPREMNSLAIAAFVVALVGLCNPIGILGLIFGYIAKGQIKRRNNSGSGLATAGIVLGWISVIGFILLIVAFAAGAFGAFADKENWDKY
ncbi:MAG: DUF4190 domain-containing protein [Stackebrandtia sp.]